MSAITIADLNNAKQDVDHIAAIATSSAPTAMDRLGHVKPTLAAKLSVFDTALTGKVAEFDAQLADAESDLNVYRSQAEGSADAAEASRVAINNRFYVAAYATPPTTRPDGSPIQNGDEYTGTDNYRYGRIAGAWVNLTAAAAASAAAANTSAVAASVSEGNAGGSAATATAKALEASNYAAAAATGAKFFDTIALGLVGIAVDGATFGVKAGGLDGLKRPTIYRRDSSVASTLLYAVLPGGEFDRSILYTAGTSNGGVNIVDPATGAVAARGRSDGGWEAASMRSRVFYGSGSDDYAFAVSDAAGRLAFVVYNNGRVVSAAGTASDTYVYVVPSYASVADINAALQTYRYVALSPGATYTINSPILIPSNTFLDFSRSTIALANGANCYMLMNADQVNGNSNIVLVRGRLNGNEANQTRSYTADYKTGYFGFGCCFTKVDNLVMDDWYIQATEAWGVAYFLCGTVSFRNFDFAQSFTAAPNGDGITGSAKRIYIENVRGYTNDDTIAVTTGKATVSGNDCGIADAANIDIDIVSIRNVVGIPDSGGHMNGAGIGIYPTAGKKIKHLLIDGVTGSYRYYGYRLQNYWTGTGTGSIDNADIRNVSPIVDPVDALGFGLTQDMAAIKVMRVSGGVCDSPSVSFPALSTTNTAIDHLIVDGVRMKTNTATAGIGLVFLHNYSTLPVARVSIRGCDVFRSDPGSVNSLAAVLWNVGSQQMTLAADGDNYVEGAATLGRSLDLAAVLKPSGVTASELVYNTGALPISTALTLQNAWAANGAGLDTRIGAVMRGDRVTLNGVAAAGTLTAATVITTLPRVMRPQAAQRIRLASVNGAANAVLDLSISTAGSVSILQALNVSAGDLFNLAAASFSTI